MNIKHFYQIFTKIGIISLIFLIVSQCGLYKKTDARKVPTNAKERVKKNIAEGKKIKFGQLGSKGSGTFEFATSNEMWRATVDILDFMPLSNVDYGGGVIITDWYNENNQKDSVKIMVQFLSNEIRADGLKVIVYNRKCSATNSVNCSTSVDNSNSVGQELKLAILKKAAEMKLKAAEKKSKEYEDKTKGLITGPDAGEGEGAKD